MGVRFASCEAQSGEPGVQVGGSGGTVTGLSNATVCSTPFPQPGVPGVQVGGSGGTVTGLWNATLCSTPFPQPGVPGVQVGGSGGTVTGLWKATLSTTPFPQPGVPGVQVGGSGGTVTGLDSETVALIGADAETGLANARPALMARTATAARTRNLLALRTMEDCSFLYNFVGKW
jgi:hypothetical protein